MESNLNLRKKSLVKSPPDHPWWAGKKEKGKIFLVLFCFILLIQRIALGQTEAKNSYWVQLKDKKGTISRMNYPEAFLSQRAIDRRNRQHIAIDSTDLTVSPVYLDSLKKLGFEIVHTSKWLNGATVRTADTALVRKAKTRAFIKYIQFTRPAKVLKSAQSKFEEEANLPYDPANYGSAINQLSQLNGEFLHRQGFRGKGIQIAILDGGFLNVNTYSAFDSLRSSGRILGTRDFVDPTSDIYQQHWHGMSVLSCIGSNLPGSIIGTAPDASFYLFRSEDVSSEYLIEEDNWVAAAEYADSLGVDVINSSLGYYQFDDSTMNHTYSAMNGKTTRVTKGANMAFQKGILVFNSAGNEGNTIWKHLIAPSDGENIIGVGAVDFYGTRASFSSVGPAYGGAIKPNVAARGSSTFLITSTGVPGTASGTSFSSPVLAGMGACLIQANPYANVKQLKMAIEQSGSQFGKPDSLLGYGIPDFEKADQYLKVNSSKNLTTESTWSVSPNPFVDELLVRNQKMSQGKDIQINISNLQGVCLWQSEFDSEPVIFINHLSNLPEGILILSIRCRETEEHFKLIRKSR